jgi:hypothetical protein
MYERLIGTLVGAPAMAWGLSIAIVICCLAYLGYRENRANLDAQGILGNSVRIESAMLQGKTEHQVVRVEESDPGGAILQQGTTDLWKDGDGNRLVRRLYDANHRLVAAQWRSGNDPASPQTRERANKADSTIDQYWDQDLSSQAFSHLQNGSPQVRAIADGYELTRVGPTPCHPQLLSATLVLDRHFQPVRQVLRVRNRDEVRELRFVQTSYEREPARSVPDSVFYPESELQPLHGRRSSERAPHDSGGQNSAQSAELEIAILYELSSLGADTAVPIEVLRVPDGRVRVSGTVSTASLKNAIVARLNRLDGHEHLDLRIVSPNELPVPSSSNRSAPVEAYEVTQPGFAANSRIRRYVLTKGVPEEHLDAAVAEFSRDALRHAQRALQHAYALDRLGSAISAAELRSSNPRSQQQWAEMVNDHAKQLEKELQSLRAEVLEISSPEEEPPIGNPDTLGLDDPEHFAKEARLLLLHVRELNQRAGSLFASNGKLVTSENLDASLKTIMNTIPLQQAKELATFAERLSNGRSSQQNAARR